MTPQGRGAAWLCIALLLTVALLVLYPKAVRTIPYAVETAVSSWVSPVPSSWFCNEDAQARAIFDHLLARIYPVSPQDEARPVKIHLLGGRTVNAFATLGGHIYIFDGLLHSVSSPDELLGVVAHELAHVQRRHVLQGALIETLVLSPLSQMLDAPAMGIYLQLRFSRDQEHEADSDAIQRLVHAHVDAAGLADFFARLPQDSSSDLTFLSSHPSSHDRAALARGAPHSPALLGGAITAKEWQSLQQICQPTGDSHRQPRGDTH